MAKKYVTKYSSSLVIREMIIKITLIFHLTSVRMTKIKNKNDKCQCGCRKGEHLFIVSGHGDGCSHYKNQSVTFSKSWIYIYHMNQLYHP